MTANDRFDRSLSTWLLDDAAFRVPDHLDEVLSVTRETRQRPAWSSLERWLPVDTTFRPRLFTVPRAGRLVMVAALILLVLAIAILAVGIATNSGCRSRSDWPATGSSSRAMTVSSTCSTRRRANADSSPLGEAFDFSPIFSRDGTKMVFLRSDGPLTEPAILSLYVANADGSEPRAVTPPTKSLDWFDWSPDGSRSPTWQAASCGWSTSPSGSRPVW